MTVPPAGHLRPGAVARSRASSAAIEQNNDAKGIIWPDAIAPFTVAICPVNYRQSDTVRQAADHLHAELEALGMDVILDDRGERPGAMFADWELIGVPHRVTVGERGLKDGKFELYEDDGLTMAYQRGAYSRIPVTYDNASGRVVIGARSGKFDGMVDKRTFKVRFIGAGAKPADFDAAADATVDYAGEAVVVTRKRRRGELRPGGASGRWSGAHTFSRARRVRRAPPPRRPLRRGAQGEDPSPGPEPTHA